MNKDFPKEVSPQVEKAIEVFLQYIDESIKHKINLDQDCRWIRVDLETAHEQDDSLNLSLFEFDQAVHMVVQKVRDLGFNVERIDTDTYRIDWYKY